MEVRRTLKEGRSSDLDSALIQWFKLLRAGNVPVSGEMIMAQAKIFHAELDLQYDCKYSQGWLQKFKTRHGITLHRICGEKSIADKDAATKFVNEFAQFIAQEKLTPEQVCNADETALYWRRLPGKTLTQETEQECTGSKDRVSVLGCIMQGDGSSPQPLHVVDRKVLDIIGKKDVNVMDFEKVIEITLPNKKEAAECGTVRNAAASTTLPATETAAHPVHADTYSAVVEKNKEDVDDQEHQELDFELKLLDSQLKKKELELKKKEIELKQKEIELKIEKIKFYQLQNKKLEQSMTCIETPTVFNKK
ncbi:tigger transposable element-derived protein 2-like [Portunus trituberculatus]|uniref:tigger transposable element-derived protein 2-like n=1 Tax=Portunus trituberculatus TaxID=210409 RepID=UPI001E1D01C9|nr:tigger transposable element-derived protein 2-like [Portunus trituberculatus]